MRPKITHVPTNIITGFLGTGKTSTIQHLLSFKPKHERWAVLVNEFGTVGIDASLYQNTNSEEGGTFVREVPGGCMCCVSGLPMQIALNVLLKLSNPHRLLIEPSGLGHPIEVVALLKSKYYQDVLDIQKVITLVDPLHFLQDKYFNHETYQQQLAVADTYVVNKTDRVTKQQLAAFKEKLSKHKSFTDRHIYTKFGQIDHDNLLGITNCHANAEVPFLDTNTVSDAAFELTQIPVEKGFLKSHRFDEGFHGTSWRFLKSYVFSRSQLLDWIKGIKAERIKGVFRTNVGIIGLNVLHDQMQIISFADFIESKLEIISKTVDPGWDETLSVCIIKPKSNLCSQKSTSSVSQ